MSSEVFSDSSAYRHCHDEGSEMQKMLDPIIRGNMQYINGELKKIPRPLNAFMIFSNEKRKELKKDFPGEPNNMISSRLGAAWKALSDEARKKYHDMAHREDLEHRRKFPNYQYCPGHARKMKKARREQRLRQQSNGYRASRQQQLKNGVSGKGAGIKTPPLNHQQDERGFEEISPVASRHHVPQQIMHGMMNHMSMAPGPHGEGGYHPASGYMAAPEGMIACCPQCKPGDIYCCQEPLWGAEPLAPPAFAYGHHYPPPMMYFPCDAPYPSEKIGWPILPDMMHSHCMATANEYAGCYPNHGYMDSCCGASMAHPMYSGGDSSVMYKDICFMHPDLGNPSPSNVATPVTSLGHTTLQCLDQEPELTDISGNMVMTQDEDDTEQPSSSSTHGNSVLIEYLCEDVPVACKEETIQ